MANGDFDLIHIHGHHYPLSWLSIYQGTKLGIPIMLSLHGMYALNPKVIGGRSTIEELFNKFVLRSILSKCDMVVGGTQGIIEHVKKYDCSNSIYRIVENGVDACKYKNNLERKHYFRSKYKIPSNNIVVLYVGRFEEVKGVLEFSQAAKKLIKSNLNFHIMMVGDGKLLTEVKSILKDLKGIQIISWVPHSQIHEMFISADIFVLSSKFEALPLTVLEAMNANLHILYTQVGGVDEILSGYNKKTVLREVNPSEIYDKVVMSSQSDTSLVKHDESLKYAQSFDWTNIAKKIDLLYDEILDN